MPLQTKNLALLAVLSAAILGSGLPTLSKIGLREIPPLSFIFTRFVLSLLFLSPIFFKEGPKLTRATLPVILVSLLATANIVLFTPAPESPRLQTGDEWCSQAMAFGAG